MSPYFVRVVSTISVSNGLRVTTRRLPVLVEVRRGARMPAGFTVSSATTSLASFLVPWTVSGTRVGLPSMSLPVEGPRSQYWSARCASPSWPD